MRLTQKDYEELMARRGKPVTQDCRPLAPAAAKLAELKRSLELVPEGKPQVRRKRSNGGNRSAHQIALLRLQRHPELYAKDREFFDQAAIFRHFELERPDIYDLLASVPNGGKRSYGVGGLLKASGQKKGYPDIVLDMPKGKFHGLRIELKAAPDLATGYEGGKLSPTQIEYLNKLHAQGYYVDSRIISTKNNRNSVSE